MPEIPFVQYMRPDGRAVPRSIEMNVDVCLLADLLMDAGYRFEAEVLSDGTVSLTIYDSAKEEDVDIELVRNPEEVKASVEKMIRRYAQKAGVV